MSEFLEHHCSRSSIAGAEVLKVGEMLETSSNQRHDVGNVVSQHSVYTLQLVVQPVVQPAG